MKKQEQLNQVKSKKMGVKDILRKDKKTPKARAHSNQRDGKMNIVQEPAPPTLQLDDDDEPGVEMNRGLLIIPQ